jgi:hypothetical protein
MIAVMSFMVDSCEVCHRDLRNFHAMFSAMNPGLSLSRRAGEVKPEGRASGAAARASGAGVGHFGAAESPSHQNGPSGLAGKKPGLRNFPVVFIYATVTKHRIATAFVSYCVNADNVK